MAINFEKFAQEGNAFMKQLATGLGHPEERGQVSILLRAVLHALRDRITVSESLHVLEQLPMFLKGVYVDHWKYRETPVKFNSMEEFTKAVEQEQAKHGERKFDWSQSTEDLIKMVFTSLGIRYLSGGQMENIVSQLPQELKGLFPIDKETHR